MQSNWMKMAAVVATSFGMAANAATTTATVEGGRRVQIGVEAGMLVNQLQGPEDLRISNRSGLAAGIVLDVPLNDMFAVRTEALYQRRSSTLAEAGGAELTTNTDSVYVPIMLRWTPGPTVTFNVNNSVEGGTRQAAAEVGYDPSSFEFGAAVGVGIDVGPVFAAARYTLGITDVSQCNADFASRGFQFLAGVRF